VAVLAKDQYKDGQIQQYILLLVTHIEHDFTSAELDGIPFEVQITGGIVSL
jgi:hypothetical protein